jgi:hypothetical protein
MRFSVSQGCDAEVTARENFMFVGPCIIVYKGYIMTNLMRRPKHVEKIEGIKKITVASSWSLYIPYMQGRSFSG